MQQGRFGWYESLSWESTIYTHNYTCVSNSLCVQCLYILCHCVISVYVYTYKALPVYLIACVLWAHKQQFLINIVRR